jgi:16S rRNA processing protein RimM
VAPISDDPRRFEAGSCLLHEGGRALMVETARLHGDRYLVKFQGVDARDDAARLRGALYVRSDELRELEKDEFWPHDLIGCEVVTRAGAAIGRIIGVVPGAAQDLLRVESKRGERLIPMVKDMVAEVDTGARRVVVDPPEGLLD